MFIEKLNVYFGDENSLLFNGANLKFYELNELEKRALRSYGAQDALTLEEIKCLEDLKTQLINHSTELTHKKSSTKAIENIKLHVSNDCNLRCSYCYADHGKYGEGKFTMDAKEGVRFASALNNHFENATSLLFFGGEPLMAVEAIESICDYNKETGRAYKYLMQTNGTISGSRVKSMIEDNHMMVTVSVDGPKEVHDVHRIFPNGSGSYDQIKETVSFLNSENRNVGFIQATYTKQAEDLYTQDHIVQLIYKDFNVPRVAVNPVFTTDENLKLKDKTRVAQEVSDLKLKKHFQRKVQKFFEDVVNNKINNDQQIKLILGAVMSGKRKELFCNAGYSQCSIDHSGNIWPCPLFTNKEQFKIGNIFDSDEALAASFEHSKSVLRNLDKDNHQECGSCPAAFWCRICVASTLTSESKEIDIDKNNCRNSKMLTEVVVETLMTLVAEGQYNDFIYKFRELASLEMI